MTIPVRKKRLGIQRIHGVRICREGRWSRKHLLSLKTAYAHAPFFEDHVGFLEDVFSAGFEKLVDFNLRIIQHLIKHLGIETRVMLLSDLGVEGKEPGLSVEICKQLGASHFLAQSKNPAAIGRIGLGRQTQTQTQPRQDGGQTCVLCLA